MKKGNEDPDNLGGLGGMLPAEVLKMLNGLLEQMHRAGHINRQQNRSSVCRLWRTACGDANKCGSLPHPLPKGREKGAGNLPEPLKRRARKRLLRSTRSRGRRRMRGCRRYRTSSWGVSCGTVFRVVMVRMVEMIREIPRVPCVYLCGTRNMLHFYLFILTIPTIPTIPISYRVSHKINELC